MKTSPNSSARDLTIREELAARAMQGLLANPLVLQFMIQAKMDSSKMMAEISKAAVEHADDLIRKLNDE